MTSLAVERYAPSMRAAWDHLVQRSKNGTFLFLRGYMEYHQDRFRDGSLVVHDEKGSLIALLPANRRGSVLESHGGLTYGGFVVDRTMTLRRMLDVVAAVLAHLRDQAISSLRYKAVPHIYHRAPAEEDLYALAQYGARLERRAALSVFDRSAGIAPQTRRRRGLRKAQAAGLTARESLALAEYWDLLTGVLQKSYNNAPVHSFAEIRDLRDRFPDNIRLFACFQGSRMVAGSLIYETETVARTQYIAASDEGKDLSALDLLFDVLFHEVYRDKRYLDLGTSEGLQGMGLNDGVLEFKEGFGARTLAQDTYEISVP
ncbi:MAG TPA: GNAT family N-acetyltransferase [Thermoanaerobaculia bacterium]|nr:GNAT family N-acetyltransferase [Thermoanaerobaculia bacterium]